LFLLVGIGDTKLQPANLENNFYKVDGRKQVFIIPHNKKQEILDGLKNMGIDKGFIYPEIDDIANYLKTEIFHPLE
jgi:predicted membrane-bound dolichyl-phosphate-mannose-protein mannosyltransferase